MAIVSVNIYQISGKIEWSMQIFSKSATGWYRTVKLIDYISLVEYQDTIELPMNYQPIWRKQKPFLNKKTVWLCSVIFL